MKMILPREAEDQLNGPKPEPRDDIPSQADPNHNAARVLGTMTGVQKYGAPVVAFLTTAAVMLIAGCLWTVGGERGQGAALAGAAAAHLIKETHDFLKYWLRS